MKIRKATLKDLESLTQFIIVFKEEVTKYEPYDLRHHKEKPFVAIKQSVKSDIENDQGIFLVVEEMGNLVGFAFGTLKKTHNIVFTSVKYGLINYIWIKEDQRKKGLASELHHALFRWFKSKGCKYIQLSVLDINPAMHLYEKWGFEKVSDTMVKVIKP